MQMWPSPESLATSKISGQFLALKHSKCFGVCGTLLTYNTAKKSAQSILQRMNFHKFNPHNEHLDQDTTSQPQSSSQVLSGLYPPNTTTHLASNNRWILPGFELHTNEIIKYILFCPCLSFNIIIQNTLLLNTCYILKRSLTGKPCRKETKRH